MTNIDKEQLVSYIAQEHQNLHDDSMRRLDRQTTIETYTVLASAAVYSFAAAKEIDNDFEAFSVFIWWLPLVISSLAHARWLQNRKVIELIGEYIRHHYEAAVRVHYVGFKGWHSFFNPIVDEADKYKLVTPHKIWHFIYLFNFCAALLGTGYIAISKQADQSCLGSLGSWLTENF